MDTLDISLKAIEKAKEKIEHLKNLNICLQAKVCPICAGDLCVKTSSHGGCEYYCEAKNCSFTWGIQKN
jgi:hypothetical protein